MSKIKHRSLIYFGLIVLSLSSLISQIESVIICKEDYDTTNYNLICPDTSQVVYVNVLTASFVLKSVVSPDCYAQSSLILNASTYLVTNLCNYCFNKDPCVITQSVLDQNRLFTTSTYKVGDVYNSMPISINILYQCINRVDLTGYPPQADLCSNPQYLTGTTRSTTTTSTRISTALTTTANGGGTGGGGGGGGATTRPPATITNPTIATKTYYPINPNGYIYCLSKSSHLHGNDHVLKLLFAAITLIFYKLIF